jgi:hypothetical protein
MLLIADTYGITLIEIRNVDLGFIEVKVKAQ